LLLESVICAPPEGAGPLSVTVPVEDWPPTTVVGLSVSEVEGWGGVTVSKAVCVAPPKVAAMPTEVDAVIALVVTVKLALDCPACTVTLDGTCATAVLLLESVICAPPEGAGPLNVTVPVEDWPPTTVVGFSVSEVRVTVGGGETDGACSKSQTDGLASPGRTTNFVGEITYATAFTPDGEVMVTDPLPFVGAEDMEYVAANAAPEVGPLALPISSVPVRLPVGLAPSALNSPEKIVPPGVAGTVAKPA
jgi:hypothetical protein